MRAVALIALGSFAIHQLHYLLISWAGTGEELQREGYSYLGHVPLGLAVLAAILIAARLVLASLGRAERGSRHAMPPLRRAALFAAAIFGVYVAQEVLEAVLFAHHAEDVLGVLAQGWWLALLLSVCLAPIFLRLDRWLGRLERLVAEIARPAKFLASRRERKPRTATEVRGALSPLAFGLARRPPPFALSRH